MKKEGRWKRKEENENEGKSRWGGGGGFGVVLNLLIRPKECSFFWAIKRIGKR